MINPDAQIANLESALRQISHQGTLPGVSISQAKQIADEALRLNAWAVEYNGQQVIDGINTKDWVR